MATLEAVRGETTISVFRNEDSTSDVRVQTPEGDIWSPDMDSFSAAAMFDGLLIFAELTTNLDQFRLFMLGRITIQGGQHHG